MIALIAAALRKVGRKSLSERCAAYALDLSPRSATALREFCIGRMTSRDFGAIKARCATVAGEPRAADRAKDVATTFLVRASLDDDAPSGILAALRNAFRARAAESAKLLRGGNRAAARDAFSEALRLAGAPRRAIPEWLGAWDAASGAIAPIPDGGEAAVRAGAAGGVAKLASAVRIRAIIPSGMYWSGSGALYAYFREFDQVAAVRGELRLWKEGDACLCALASVAREPEALRTGLLDLIGRALAGTGPVRNWQDELAAGYALKAMRADRAGRYARACRAFAETVAFPPIPGREDETYAEAAARFSDELVRLWSVGRGEYALLDNAVHIANVEAVRLFGDATALCVFRDPRSTFVARWNENPRFHRDVRRFIDYYRATIERFESALAASPATAARVKRVGFEEFIMSSSYREELARSLGLDPGRMKAGRFFNPEASRKNVRIYRDFADREAIGLIERELGAHCVEIVPEGAHG